MPPDPPSHPITADSIAAERLRGFNAELGFRIVEWRTDFARVEMTLEDWHLNRSGVVHGGVLASMLDATLGFCGIYTGVPGRARRAVTLTMTTSYVGQTKSGVLSCSAQRRGGGKTIFMASGEVRDDTGNLLAFGEGTFRYVADTPR